MLAVRFDPLTVSCHLHIVNMKKTIALDRLILEIFRVNGRLIAAGDILVKDIGLTGARWQVLGAIATSSIPLPVAHIARRMGLTLSNCAVVGERNETRWTGAVRTEPRPSTGATGGSHSEREVGFSRSHEATALLAA